MLVFVSLFFFLTFSSFQWRFFWHTHVMRHVIKIPLNINISAKRLSFKIWNYADHTAGEIYFHAGPSSLHSLKTVSISWVNHNKRLLNFNKTHVVMAEISLQRHNIKAYGSFWKSSLKEITTY